MIKVRIFKRNHKRQKTGGKRNDVIVMRYFHPAPDGNIFRRLRSKGSENGTKGTY